MKKSAKLNLHSRSRPEMLKIAEHTQPVKLGACLIMLIHFLAKWLEMLSSSFLISVVCQSNIRPLHSPDKHARLAATVTYPHLLVLVPNIKSSFAAAIENAQANGMEMIPTREHQSPALVKGKLKAPIRLMQGRCSWLMTGLKDQRRHQPGS